MNLVQKAGRGCITRGNRRKFEHGVPALRGLSVSTSSSRSGSPVRKKYQDECDKVSIVSCQSAPQRTFRQWWFTIPRHRECDSPEPVNRRAATHGQILREREPFTLFHSDNGNCRPRNAGASSPVANSKCPPPRQAMCCGILIHFHNLVFRQFAAPAA